MEFYNSFGPCLSELWPLFNGVMAPNLRDKAQYVRENWPVFKGGVTPNLIKSWPLLLSRV